MHINVSLPPKAVAAPHGSSRGSSGASALEALAGAAPAADDQDAVNDGPDDASAADGSARAGGKVTTKTGKGQAPATGGQSARIAKADSSKEASGAQGKAVAAPDADTESFAQTLAAAMIRPAKAAPAGPQTTAAAPSDNDTVVPTAPDAPAPALNNPLAFLAGLAGQVAPASPAPSEAAPAALAAAPIAAPAPVLAPRQALDLTQPPAADAKALPAPNLQTAVAADVPAPIPTTPQLTMTMPVEAPPAPQTAAQATPAPQPALHPATDAPQIAAAPTPPAQAAKAQPAPRPAEAQIASVAPPQTDDQPQADDALPLSVAQAATPPAQSAATPLSQTPKSAAPAIKTAGKADAAPAATAAGKPVTVASLAAGPVPAPGSKTTDQGSPSFGGEAPSDAPATVQAGPDPAVNQAQTAFAPIIVAARDAAPVPASETLARLATQIVQTAQGPASQFTLNLHPAELGGVQVKIQVDRRGAVSASLTFDNPQAAADLKAHSADLKAALNQAGFDVSDDGLSFNLNGRGQQSAQDSNAEPGAWARQAFRPPADPETLLTTVNEAAARLQGARGASGLDIRI
jgi:flagellar hook-length control protein FliK